MKYSVLVEDSAHGVEIHEEGDTRTVYWDGKPVDLDCPLTLSNHKTSILLDGHPYEISWKQDNEWIFVNLNQAVYKVRVNRGTKQKKQKKTTQGAHEEIISAPMPGMVVDLKVNPDQEVKMGEPLIILEAMKMENELRCPIDGRVKTIHAKAGQKVEKGEKLIVLKNNI